MKMTEREAWLVLAKAWTNAKKINTKKINSGEYEAAVEELKCWGLCTAINVVWRAGKIAKSTADSMSRKIAALGDTEGHPLDHPFVWSITTDAGRLARVRFCKEQAKKLASPKRKAKA